MKKRVIILLTVFLIVLGIVGCRADEVDKTLQEQNDLINQLTAEVTTLKGNLGTLETWSNQAKNQITALSALQDEVAGVKEQVSGLNTGLASTKSSVSELQTSLQGLQTALNGKANSSDIPTLQDAIQAVSDALEGKLNASELAAFQESVGALQASVLSYAGQVATVDAKLNELQTGEQADAEDIIALQNAVAELNTQAAQFVSSFNALQTLVNGKANSTDLAALQTTVGTLQTELATLQAAGTNLQNALTTLGTKVDGIDGRLTTAEGTLATLQNTLAQKAEQIESALGLINGQLTTLGTNLTEVGNTLTALQTTVGTKANASDVTALQTSVSALDTKANNLGEALAIVQNGLEALGEATGLLQEEKASVESLQALADQVTALANGANLSNEQLQLLLDLDPISGNQYADATSLLAGTYDKLTDTEKADWAKIVKDINDKLVTTLDFEGTGLYSHAAWKVIDTAVRTKEALFLTLSYKAYDVYELAEYFFLNRDLTTQDVMGRFSDLRDYIVGMPTMEEGFYDLIDTITVITVDTIKEGTESHTQWLSLVQAYNNSKENHADDEKFAEYEETYLALKAAYDNLVAAKEWADGFVEIVEGRNVDEETGVPFLSVEDESHDYTNDAAALAEIADVYFDEENIVKYYPEGYGMKDLIPETCEEVAARKAAITELQAAEEALEALELTLPGYEAETWLYNTANFNKIEPEFDSVTAWIEEYSDVLIDANRDYIYNKVEDQTYASAKAINKLAEDLEAVYQTKVVETQFAEKVLPLQAEGFVVEYADKETLSSYRDLFEDLEEAIEEVINEFVEENYNAMLAKATIDEGKYEDVEDRLAELAIAQGLIDAQALKIAGFFNEEGNGYVVTLKDYQELFGPAGSVRAVLDAIYAEYEIEKYVVPAEDEEEVLTHNRAMNKPVELAYIAIAAAYDDMAKDLKDAIDAANEALSLEAGKGGIYYASNIQNSNISLGNMVSLYGIDTQNVVVTSTGTSYNFDQLVDRVKNALANIANNAAYAQADYVGQAANIENVSELKVEDVKLSDKEAIKVAYNGLKEWVETYFDEDLREEHSIVELVAAVQKTDGYDNFFVNAKSYTFYTNEEAEHIVALNAKFDEVRAAAVADWASLSSELEGLNALRTYNELSEKFETTYTIHDHDSFATGAAHLWTYLTKYYENVVEVVEEEEVVTGVVFTNELEEAVVRAKFNEIKVVYDEFYAAAEAAANDINTLIGAVSSQNALVLTPANLAAQAELAQDILNEADGKLADIQGAIAEFKETYDNKEFESGDGCDAWFEDVLLDKNYEFYLTRTIYMAEAVKAVKAAVEAGVDFVDANELYDQWVQTYMYNLAMKKSHLDNYNGILGEKIADAKANAAMWLELKAELVALNEKEIFSIHDKEAFDTAASHKKAFVEGNYIELFGNKAPKLAVLEAFDDAKEAFDTFYEEAEAEAEDVNEIINGVVAITPISLNDYNSAYEAAVEAEEFDDSFEQYLIKEGGEIQQAASDDYDEMIDAVNDFNTDYDSDECNELFEGLDDAVLVLNKNYNAGRALIKVADTLLQGATLDGVNPAYTTFLTSVAAATSVDDIQNAYNVFKDALSAAIPD